MPQKWVPIGRATINNVPYFALGSERARANRACNETKKKGLSFLIGSQAANWLTSNIGQTHISIYETRNFMPPKTAVYIEWLVFHDATAANAFLEAFPRFSPETRIARLKKKSEQVSDKINQRTWRAGYDIGRHPEDQRRAIANHYIKLDNELREFRAEIREIEIAEVLAKEWESQHAVVYTDAS